MGDGNDRAEQAASQIDLDVGDKISLQFDSDRPHYHTGQTSGEKHNDAWSVEKMAEDQYEINKMHSDAKKQAEDDDDDD